ESGLFSGNKLTELNNEYFKIKNEISKSGRIRNTSVSEIQKTLDDKENLITFFFGNENLYAFILNKQNFSAKKLNITKQQTVDLLKKIAPFYAAENQNSSLYFNQDLFSFNTRSANEFYTRVIKPALNNIPKGNKLIFSLPKELAFVPLEFLVTEFKED